MEKFVQPFISTCKNVFQNFLSLEAQHETPYFIEHKDHSTWDISGIIGLTGEAEGAVSISLKNDFAIHIANILTGQQHDTMDELVVDAIGEIINIIAGNVKKELEEMFRLVISLPTIITGENHETYWHRQSTRAICIPFTVDNTYSFALSVALKNIHENN